MVLYSKEYLTNDGYKMAKPKNIFLLRKNREGNESLVVNETDFPIRLNFYGKYYVVELTKSRKMIMKAE